ncbi:MAG: polysaccharide biosynthesis/export family protein [Thiohalocapsa sp.]|nr:polysaccharide biosynthesis/export family protein [Thiohalocapsa sp.]
MFRTLSLISPNCRRLPSRSAPLLAALALALTGCAVAPRTPPLPVLDEPPPLQRPDELKAAPTRISRSMTTEEQLAALRESLIDTRAIPTLGKGDILTVSVYDEPDLTVDGIPVRPDGMISFPLVGDVQAAGRSVDELTTSLSERLANFVIQPKVAVIVQQLNSQNYTISGEVEQPGVYPLVTDVRLTEAVARAGGLKKGLFRSTSVDIADLSSAFIARRGTLLPVDFSRLFRQGDLRFDIELQAGDYIRIPSGLTQEVYIVGEINKPFLFPFREEMPLTKTLALAEGFTEQADLKRVHVVRGALSNPELIIVSVKDVLNGKAQDLHLAPGDIVYVPPTYLTNWARMLDQIVPTVQAIQTGIILSNLVSDDGN